jgi:amino acid permease
MELSAVAVLVNYWNVAHISNAVWITIALVVVINLFGSRNYGEAEF